MGYVCCVHTSAYYVIVGAGSMHHDGAAPCSAMSREEHGSDTSMMRCEGSKLRLKTAIQAWTALNMRYE